MKKWQVFFHISHSDPEGFVFGIRSITLLKPYFIFKFRRWWLYWKTLKVHPWISHTFISYTFHMWKVFMIEIDIYYDYQKTTIKVLFFFAHLNTNIHSAWLPSIATPPLSNLIRSAYAVSILKRQNTSLIVVLVLF